MDMPDTTDIVEQVIWLNDQLRQLGKTTRIGLRFWPGSITGTITFWYDGNAISALSIEAAKGWLAGFEAGMRL